MKAAPLLLLALLPIEAAASQDGKWTRLSEDRDGVLSYDRATIARTGNRVRIEVRMVAVSDTPWSIVGMVEFDCATPSIAYLSGAQYGAGPEPLKSWTTPPERLQREPLFEGSKDEALYRFACPDGAPLPKFDGPPLMVVPDKDSAKP